MSVRRSARVGVARSAGCGSGLELWVVALRVVQRGDGSRGGGSRGAFMIIEAVLSVAMMAVRKWYSRSGRRHGRFIS